VPVSVIDSRTRGRRPFAFDGHWDIHVHGESQKIPRERIRRPANENGLKWTEVDSLCSYQIQILIF